MIVQLASLMDAVHRGWRADFEAEARPYTRLRVPVSTLLYG